MHRTRLPKKADPIFKYLQENLRKLCALPTGKIANNDPRRGKCHKEIHQLVSRRSAASLTRNVGVRIVRDGTTSIRCRAYINSHAALYAPQPAQ